MVLVTVGYQHSPREKIFEAVIDAVEVKRIKELSPRDIEHDNPEFRRLDETIHFLEQIYGRAVSEGDMVTVVHFSAISERPEEITERLRPAGPSRTRRFGGFAACSSPASPAAVCALALSLQLKCKRHP